MGVTLTFEASRSMSRPRPLRHFALVMLIVTMAMLRPGGALGSELPIIDLLPPRVERGSIEKDLNRWLSERTGDRQSSVRLKAPPQALLDSAKWMPSPEAIGSCQAMIDELAGDLATPGERLSADAAFKALMERADISLLELSLDKVLLDVSAAWAILPCRQSILKREDLRRLFLFEAVTHFYLDNGRHEALFLELLSADPRLYLEPDYPPRVQDAFLKVAQEVSRVTPARLPTGTLSGKVFLDGAPMVGDAMVQPGRHVLQIQGPYGDTRTVILPVSRIDAGADPLNLPQGLAVTLSLPGDDATIARLAKGLLGDPPEADAEDAALPSRTELSREALIRWMNTAGVERVAIALGPGADVMVFEASGQRRPPSLDAIEPLLEESAPSMAYPGARASSGPSAGVGLAYLAFATPGEPSVLHPSHLGLGLRGAMPLGPIVVTARGSISFSDPIRERGVGAAGAVDDDDDNDEGEADNDDDIIGCGSYLGGTPTEDQIDSAANCIPLRPAGEIALGVGLDINLPGKLALTPSVMISAAVIPEILTSGGPTGEYLVYRSLAAGPLLAANLRYDLDISGQPVRAWVEPSIGTLFTTLSGRTTLALPIGLLSGVEVVF